jgi:hypothetical protein
MFRDALALYFFVTTVAGPWLNCCCVLAAKADPKGKPAVQAPLTHEGCACCRESAMPAPRPAPAPAATSPHQKCRCQFDRPPAVLTQPKNDTESASALTLQIPADVQWSHPSMITSVSQIKDEAGPISSCRDRLTVLHVLRC